MEPPRKFPRTSTEAFVEDDVGVADVGWKLPWKSSTNISVDVFVEVSMKMIADVPVEESMEVHGNVHGKTLESTVNQGYFDLNTGDPNCTLPWPRVHATD